MTDYVKTHLSTLAIIILTLTQPVAAVPTTIVDNYIGADNNGYGDVIGSPRNFQITSMDVSLSGSTLSVSIFTTFAGKGDNHLFDRLTGGAGIGYGDLLLSGAWTPFGSAPYIGDNNITGTLWTYGFALDNRWWNGIDGSGGTGTLYRLNGATNDANTLLSGDFLTGGVYRNGQEVAVDTAGQTNVGNGTWSIVDGTSINFVLDLSATTLLSGDEIALHWGFTCGNDVIEGAIKVPEPGMLLLMASGLLGLGIGLRYRNNTENR